MNISIRLCNSNFAHSFDSHCLTNFAKRYKFVVGGFFLLWVIMWTFNLNLEGWSIDDNMVSKIWVGMSSTNTHLLLNKIQSHLKNADFECRYKFRTHTEEQPSKIFNIATFVNCGHLKKNFTAPWLKNLVEYSYLLPKHSVKILREKKWAFSFYFTFCKRGILHVSLWRVA